MYGNSKRIPQSLTCCNWLVAQALLIMGIWGLIVPEVAWSQAKKSSAPARTPTAEPQSAPKSSLKPVLKTGSRGTEVGELQGMLKLLGYYTGAVNGVYDESTAAAVSSFQKAANLSADGVAGADTWNRLLPPSAIVTTTSPAKVDRASATSSTNPGANPAAAESFPMPSEVKPSEPSRKPNSTPSPKSSTTNTTASATSTGSDSVTGGQETVMLPTLRLGMKGPAVTGLQERLRALGYLKSSSDGVFGTETQAAVKAAQRQFSLESDGVVGPATWSGLLR